MATYSEYIIEVFFGMTKSTQMVTGIGPSKARLDFPMQKESFSLPFGMALLLQGYFKYSLGFSTEIKEKGHLTW